MPKVGEGIMIDIIWDQPVRVERGLIFGPREAWEFMQASWPHRKDPHFARASETILAALDGRVSPDLAREYFEAALKSAELSQEG
jgi:hypothetical protein